MAHRRHVLGLGVCGPVSRHALLLHTQLGRGLEDGLLQAPHGAFQALVLHLQAGDQDDKLTVASTRPLEAPEPELLARDF